MVEKNKGRERDAVLGGELVLAELQEGRSLTLGNKTWFFLKMLSQQEICQDKRF